MACSGGDSWRGHCIFTENKSILGVEVSLQFNTNMRILIIDDDIETLTSMNFLFSINGYTVETEPLWQNAFNKIELFKPDIILLDVHLRGEDGRNICRQIKSDPQTMHIYIILFSASPTLQSDIKGCFADDFIGKPFKINVLLEKINYRFSKN